MKPAGPSAAAAGGHARRLGLGTAVALVVANMIGSGVFTTSGFALEGLGDGRWVLAAWLAGGAIALLGALSYGALAMRLPESGGEYLFLSVTVHPLAGFLAGWVSLLAGFTAPIAVAALALQEYVSPGLGLPWLATGAVAAAGLAHGVRLAPGVVVQNAAVVLKLAAILALVAAGALLGELRGLARAPGGAAQPSAGAFAVALMYVSFSYSGWNAAVYVAGEVRDPRRNVPRALWMGALGVTAVYLLLNALFLAAAPFDRLAGRADVAAVAAEALGGPALAHAVGGLVALALWTSVSAMVMAGPRVYARMARDGMLPAWVARGGEAPRAAIALQVALACAAVWIAQLEQLLLYAGYVLSFSAALTVVGLLAWRRRESGRRAVGSGDLAPLAFLFATLVIGLVLVLEKPLEVGLGLATVAAGAPLYWAFARRPRGST